MTLAAKLPLPDAWFNTGEIVDALNFFLSLKINKQQNILLFRSSSSLNRKTVEHSVFVVGIN